MYATFACETYREEVTREDRRCLTGINRYDIQVPPYTFRLKSQSMHRRGGEHLSTIRQWAELLTPCHIKGYNHGSAGILEMDSGWFWNRRLVDAAVVTRMVRPAFTAPIH